MEYLISCYLFKTRVIARDKETIRRLISSFNFLTAFYIKHLLIRHINPLIFKEKPFKIVPDKLTGRLRPV
jgi:hypothetical protein